MSEQKLEYIFKVKTKFIINTEELVKSSLYIININFEFYQMEERGIKGYYSKILKISPALSLPVLPVFENDVEENTENWQISHEDTSLWPRYNSTTHWIWFDKKNNKSVITPM